MRIATVQIVSGADPRANLDQVAEQTAQAADEGVDLVIFPEATMRQFGRPLAEVAEPPDGPWAARLAEIAARHGVVIVAGMFGPADGGRVTNTLRVVGRGVDAHYDKIHLFDAFGFTESDTVAPGTEPLVLRLGDLGVGFATCYDLRFPGLFTTLAERGAQLICVPASWGAGPGKIDQWQLLIRARALDCTSYLAAAGQADPATVGQPTGSAPTGVGYSAVVGPDGTVLTSLGPEPGRLLVDIDPEVVAATRRTIPVLANRRI
jgi:deaminated glutathione amidase